MWISKKNLIVLVFISLQSLLYCEDLKNDPVPVTVFFNDLGQNILGTVSYCYGVPFLASGLITYVFIETGVDWAYNRFAYNHEPLAKAASITDYIGFATPVLIPIGVYLGGRFEANTKMQIAGLAIAQAVGITEGYHLILKLVTGRKAPGITKNTGDNRNTTDTEDYSDDFAFGFARRGFIDGWPSGHTMAAISTAVVLSEIYNDNLAVKISSWSFAAFISIGISLSGHWASDVIAGVLMSYATGKVVARSFNKLLSKKENDNVSLIVLPNYIGVNFRY
jgi:membrane-associated phospholipid phosphatase